MVRSMVATTLRCLPIPLDPTSLSVIGKLALPTKVTGLMAPVFRCCSLSMGLHHFAVFLNLNCSLVSPVCNGEWWRASLHQLLVPATLPIRRRAMTAGPGTLERIAKRGSLVITLVCLLPCLHDRLALAFGTARKGAVLSTGKLENSRSNNQLCKTLDSLSNAACNSA
jgi:hypothetical protein